MNNILQNFLLRVIYLPLVNFLNFISQLPLGFLPPKGVAFFKIKRNLPTIPKFGVAPILIHASSGEIEYARALIRKIRAKNPEIPIVVSYSSPSAPALIARMTEQVFATPLPLDTPQDMANWLSQINPRLVVIAKTDLWPFFLLECRRLSIPTFLISLQLSKTPGFWQRMNLSFIKEIFVMDSSTQEILTEENLNSSLAGDTRIDQALFRRQEKEKNLKVSRTAEFTGQDKNSTNSSDYKLRFIAGSTWPEDEEVFGQIIPKFKEIQFFIVPHEIHAEQIAQFRQNLEKHQVSLELWSENKAKTSQVIIVDTWGILADLYQTADVAFVGGSFRSKVHSVMEPLVWGIPTFVGPYYKNNFEALTFSEKKIAGIPVVQVSRDAEALSADLQKYVKLSKEELAGLKLSIRKLLEDSSGATDIVFSKIISS
ncbi:MAG: glycosyltransferase N-terminal domain-containing protein [Bdellovibrionota bacterium]